MNSCPVCGELLVDGLARWHKSCVACSYEGSTLSAHILEQLPEGDLDEAAREDALAPLRRENFAKLAARVGSMVRSRTGKRPRLLDVGCAHGWFLDATSEGFDITGIEPDRGVAAMTAARGLPIRGGFFPDVLEAGELFDAIVFNDVLEHIPDVNSILEACRSHLVPGGLLVINAPNRTGILYRISKLMSRLGLPGTFERMWQKGFPSPHVHYFDSNSIGRLAEAHGFNNAGMERLRSVSLAGLYDRVRYSRDVSPLKAGLTSAAVAMAVPVLPLLPPDIRVWFLVRDDQS